MSSLQQLQKRMANSIMQPLTPAERMRRSRGGRSMKQEAAAFIKPNSRLTSFERLEIYNRQYWFRVLASLAEDFPGLRAVVGEKQFARISRDYLTMHPSQSFTLRNLGSRLSGWLEQNPEYMRPFPELALEMAKLEWAHIEAFDAAEREPLSAVQAAGLGGDSKLALQPHLQLLNLLYPVDDILLAVRRSKVEIAGFSAAKREKWLMRFPAADKLCLVVHRAEFSVHYKRVEKEAFLLLDALLRGFSIAEAIEQSFAEINEAAGDCARRVQGWFATWRKMGWICQGGAR